MIRTTCSARCRLGAASPASGGRDAELDWLTGCIQALRAKTVELLNRYGLSLSELDLQRQACEAAAAETGRKRVGPVDDYVPSIAAFSDCRAWGEKGLVARSPHVLRPARGRRGGVLPV